MKCDFPDDMEWPSRGAAEVALGLPRDTISGWVHKGRYVRPPMGYNPRSNFLNRYPDGVRMGDIRELVESHRERKKRDIEPGPVPERMTLKDRIRQRRESG